jgi:cytochrome c peroxidase
MARPPPQRRGQSAARKRGTKIQSRRQKAKGDSSMRKIGTVWHGVITLVVFGLMLSAPACKQQSPPEKGEPSSKATDTSPADEKPQPSEIGLPAEPPEPPLTPIDELDKRPGPASPSPPPGDALEPKVPLGLPPLPVPDDDPLTEAKIELGKLLYFDKRLSKDGTVSCATCHDPKMAWAEDKAVSTGIGGLQGTRNSPTVINAAYARNLFWDGRAATLEEQALGPIENPVEMGHKLDELVAELNKIEGYRTRFQKVFGTEVTKEGIARAIAAFERTVLGGNSPYDRFVAGDETALNASQKRGLVHFERYCQACHPPPLFSNFRFINAGVGLNKDKPDPGRMEVTKDEQDRGKFRVPPLREVARTPPYFHDGSVKTLAEAVALMAAGGAPNPQLSPLFLRVRDAQLGPAEQQELVAFLEGLSGEFPIIEPPELP